ncbi:MAG: hypothetical protein ACEPO8_09960, partial [Rhodothermaceae bacterium]
KSYSSSVTEVTLFSNISNPALLAKSNNIAGISIIPQTFGLQELSQKSVGSIHNFSSFTFGSSYQNYGFELFRQQIFSVGISKKITDNFFVGSSLVLDFLDIKNYGSKQISKINIGVSFSPSEKLNLGFAIKNLLQKKFTDSDIAPQSNILLGISYLPTKNFSLHFQIDKERNRDISIAAGLELGFYDFLSVRSGYSDNPDIYSFGISIKLKLVEIDYAVQIHSYLEETQMFGVKINY